MLYRQPVLQSMHQHLSGVLLCLRHTLIMVRVVATSKSHLFNHPKWTGALFIKSLR